MPPETDQLELDVMHLERGQATLPNLHFVNLGYGTEA